MTYGEIVARVSAELGLPKTLVDKTYKTYWRSIKILIEAMPLKEGLTEEEFRSIKTSFNIPSLGKLAVKWSLYVLKREGWEHPEECLKCLEEGNDKIEED